MRAETKDVEAAELPSQSGLRRRHKEPGQGEAVASNPFAGRIGGNQEFTVSPAHSIVSKLPDAAPKFTWKQSLSARGFYDEDLWKQAMIEGVGTCLQVYLAGLYAIGLAPIATKSSLGPVTPTIVASLTNVLLISLFIYSGGPVSGGHFNPLITISTFTARLSAGPRTLLYVFAQCSGAIVAGFLVRASLGQGTAPLRTAPGCYIDSSLVTPGQAYILETMSCFALIFIAFGVGLDPRQVQVLGPALSPILVGLALGLCSFASGFVKAGYTGASMNPARCLGLMAAAERFDYHYIHWFGDITAAVLNGLMYWIVPIYKE